MILARLFGSRDIGFLVSLPREDLLNLALSQPMEQSPSNSVGQASVSIKRSPSEECDSLEILEQAPNDDTDFEDFKPGGNFQHISDEVNGLSTRLEKQASYVGVSSVNAAIKVIFKTAPVARQCMQNQMPEKPISHRPATPPDPQDVMTLPPLDEANGLIESFFERVHPFFPMVDEETFWQTHLSGARKDTSWLALLNMVFTLGSVAAHTADSEAHIVFFRRARAHINPKFETFGNPNIEILQALGMMGGYYMHYLNRPNEADALMGATLRVACALGFHREYLDTSIMNTKGNPVDSEVPRRVLTADTRRRTWWSLFCLDTWASTTTGRPSLGRISLGVTVREPVSSPEDAVDPKDPQSLKLLPLIHSVAFCKIATTIQDKLSSSPTIPFDEVVQLDADLVRWWDDLPSILTTDLEDTIPTSLQVPRLIMKWRYQNLRIVLHRPYLLSAALRKAQFQNLTAEEKVSIGKCRLIAAKTIGDIASECKEDVICGWNGVYVSANVDELSQWLAYQATFVPLVSLFSDTSSHDETEKWRATLNTAIGFLTRMKHSSLAAEKSRLVVSKLLEAAKSSAEAADAQRRQQEALMAVKAQRERDREHQLQQQHQQQQHQQQQQQIYNMNGSHPHQNGMDQHQHHHQDSVHSPINQLAPSTLPHPGMCLPISLSLGLGINAPTALPNNVSTTWQDPISAGGMGSTTPQGVPPGGAFWDDMMWDSFTPLPGSTQNHHGFQMEAFANVVGDGVASSWSPHAGDVSAANQGWNGFAGHGHGGHSM
ncbi:hypothetical protein Vi05172_g6879 [Venturia inaequalis]|nr:hypothetical protein Vi05172_g6879 [Venturia inaequalis]